MQAELGENFAEDHTRHHRIAREMSLQEKFVAAHVVGTDGFFAVLHHFVD